jgi:hypothetical protein
VIGLSPLMLVGQAPANSFNKVAGHHFGKIVTS